MLAIITASGLIYNLGLLAGPWFEGRMAETLVHILQKTAGNWNRRGPAMC